MWLYIFICMYVCIYTCICICVYIYIYTDIWIFIYIYTFLYINTFIYTGTKKPPGSTLTLKSFSDKIVVRNKVIKNIEDLKIQKKAALKAAKFVRMSDFYRDSKLFGGICFLFLSLFASASLSFMDPLFLIIIDIFLYLCLFGWSVWKRIEYRFCDILSL
jgi:hypothetical protein